MFYTAITRSITPYKAPDIGKGSKMETISRTKRSKVGNERKNPGEHMEMKVLKKGNRSFLTMKDLETKLLATQGLIMDKNVWSYNVELPKTKEFIHTLEAGKENKQTIVLVHGFGAVNLFWFKVIPHLIKHFHVYAIDQLGTGQSSRPDYYIEDFKGAVSFFCDAIEEWRQKLNLEDFLLMGHSFGGYTVSQYVMKFNPPIKKLLLLSPAGFTGREDKEIGEMAKKTFNTNAVAMLGFRFVFNLLQNLKFTPFQLTNIFGRQRGLMGFLGGPRLNMTKTEATLMAEYYYRVSELKWSSDKGLGDFLHFGRYSKRPLIYDLKEKKKNKGFPPIQIFYGERDWMDFNHSKEMNKKLNAGFDIKVLKNCGHQILLQVPIAVASEIGQSVGIDIEPVTVINCLDSNFNVDEKRLDRALPDFQ